MELSRRKQQQCKKVYSSIIQSYEIFKSTNGTLSCQSLYKSMASGGAGKSGFNSSVVRPYPSDFICEIEIIAEKVLTKEELEVFYSGESTKDRDIKLSIACKMGCAFIEKKIYPIEIYFKPLDTR